MTTVITAPVPSSIEAWRRLSRVRRRGTDPEIRLRQELHRRGLRYRVDSKPEPSIPRRTDIVFAGARLAVFVDGCFWHGCTEHRSIPVANHSWWAAKLARIVARDRDTCSG